MTTNILIVEDDPLTQKLLSYYVTQCGYSVTQALDVAGAMTHLRKSLPDLIVLDWMLPGSSGIELVRHLNTGQLTSNIPIIMLSARNSESDKIIALETGADDYITKPFSPRELMARIRAKLRNREFQMSDEILCGEIELSIANHCVKVKGEIVEIGRTEFRILHLLMNHPERVYSRSQLLDHVWGNDVMLNDRVVDVNIRRLRQALEPFGLDVMIQTVRGSGYRLHVNSKLLASYQGLQKPYFDSAFRIQSATAS